MASTKACCKSRYTSTYPRGRVRTPTTHQFSVEDSIARHSTASNSERGIHTCVPKNPPWHENPREQGPFEHGAVHGFPFARAYIPCIQASTEKTEKSYILVVRLRACDSQDCSQAPEAPWYADGMYDCVGDELASRALLHQLRHWKVCFGGKWLHNLKT